MLPSGLGPVLGLTRSTRAARQTIETEEKRRYQSERQGAEKCRKSGTDNGQVIEQGHVVARRAKAIHQVEDAPRRSEHLLRRYAAVRHHLRVRLVKQDLRAVGFD